MYSSTYKVGFRNNITNVNQLSNHQQYENYVIYGDKYSGYETCILVLVNNNDTHM